MEGILSFFKKYTKKWAIEKDISKGANNNWSSGGFMDEPNFLIQAFIFEYFSTKEEITDFIQHVHTVLNEIIKRN